MQRRRYRSGPVLLSALVVLGLVTGAALSVATVATASTQQPAADTPPVAAVTDAEAEAQRSVPVANNSSIRHRNPVTVAAEDGRDELAATLRSRLAARLNASATEIDQGQYERARSLLGEEYLEDLERYREVADARDGDAGETIEEFNETRTTQREYARTITEFRRTHEAYRDAKARGDEQAARAHARELLRLQRNASRQADQLNEGYGRLRGRTTVDRSPTQERLAAVQTDISTDAAAVERAEFVQTDLVIRTASTTGSFTDPLLVEATLESEAGPVTGSRIRIEVGERTYETETDDEGTFTVRYHPTLVPANASTVELRYLPDDESRYSGSTASVPVDLDPVIGSIELDETTPGAGFGDRVDVAGRVTVDEIGVAEIPLVVQVGDTRLGTVRTADDGTFAIAGNLTATPETGTVPVVVRSAVTGRAVAVSPASTVLTVRETATTLSADATREAGRVQLIGQLTADGHPVPDQRVVVSAAGGRLGTVQTGASGSFRLGVDDSEGAETVRLRFDGNETNLASAETVVTVVAESARASGSVAAENATGGSSNTDSTTGVAAIVAFAGSPLGIVTMGLLIGIGGFVLAVVLRQREGTTTTPSTETSMATFAEGSASDSDGSSPVVPRDQFGVVESALATGRTTDAVLGAYGLVRATLSDRLPISRSSTHRQFFDAGVAAGVDPDALQTLTETYERARYGYEPVSPSVAREAIDAARTVLDDSGDTDAEDGLASSQAGDG